MTENEIKKHFDEWWEKHQLSKSSMDQDDAIYAFKYGYKARDKEISELKEKLKIALTGFNEMVFNRDVEITDLKGKLKIAEKYFTEIIIEDCVDLMCVEFLAEEALSKLKETK